MPDPQLQAIIDKAIQAGYSDEDIRLLAQEHQRRTAPESEQSFKKWYAEQAQRYDLNPNPDAPEQFYDWRAAYRAGATPDASRHWPSDFKKPGHPNEVVGGFNTRTGERVPGTARAGSVDELVKLGWDRNTAIRLMALPEPSTKVERVRAAIAAGDPEDARKHQRVIGVVKGAGNTAFGLGKIAHDYTPVGRISDAIQPGAFDQRPPELTPTNPDQQLGFAAEQIGEFFIPAGAAGKIGKAADVGKSALLTKAQTGSTADAGVSAALTAAAPAVMSVAGTAAGMLSESARKTMAQALGATKEWAKSEAAKLAPEMLSRGVRGSRPAMLAQAKSVASRVGGELNAAYKAATAAGDTVPGLVIRGHVQIARDAMKVRDASGALAVIPGTERVVQQMDRLDEFIASLGDDIPVDKAAAIKRTWDGIVSKAGLFGPKATASATDSADAYAIREASGAFRELLNRNPTIEALNKELGFWTGLKKVLKETEKRTQAQSGGLVAAGMGGSGAVVGALSGDSLSDRASKAVLGGLAGRSIVKLVQSPWWRTSASGPFKQSIANALASGVPERIQSVITHTAAAMPAQLRPAAGQ